MAKLEALLSYCTANKRVCPQPRLWQQFWDALPDKRQRGRQWHPDVPFVLGGWRYTDDQSKRQRLAEHIRWAEAHGALDFADDFLRGLQETDWHHEGGRR